MEEAPADFDEHLGKVAEDLCDESGFLGLVRLTTEPAAFHSKLTCVMMCKHLDDGMVQMKLWTGLWLQWAIYTPFENELSIVGVGDKIFLGDC